MTYIGSTEFYQRVAAGLVPGHSLVHKFGRNDAVPNGSWAVISLTAAFGFLSAATTVRVKAGGNAADTATTGAGARTVTVQGIDSNLVELSETIDLAGASASTATTAQFWRVYRAWVASVGTYGAANTAAIVVENSAGGTDIITIGAGEGQSQKATFTIPSGKTGYLLSIHVTVDSGKTANVRCFTRADFNDVTAPMPSKRLKLFWDGLAGSFAYKPFSPELSIPALSDIWFEGYGDGATSQISVDFELLLIDD